MSEEHMNDSTFGRLFIIMIIAMILMTVAIVVIAKFAANDVDEKLEARSDIENSQSLAERISPVGSLATNSSSSSNTTTISEPVVLSGADAYASCAACHASGVAGAPLFGNKAAWADRITKGNEALYINAINGFQGSTGYMPAKGGNTLLSDESIKAAVDYMIQAVE